MCIFLCLDSQLSLSYPIPGIGQRELRYSWRYKRPAGTRAQGTGYRIQLKTGQCKSSKVRELSKRTDPPKSD